MLLFTWRSWPCVLFSLLCAHIVSATVTSAFRGIHIPITRVIDKTGRGRARARGIDSEGWHARSADLVRARYGYPTASSFKERKRQTSASVPLTDQDADLWYFGSLNVGSPPQALNIVFATGFADFFVVGSQCSGCLPSTPRFNLTQSSSYKAIGGPPVSVTLADGMFNGTNSTESVNVGPFTIQDQGFILVTQIDPKLLSGSVSGQMGLGFAGLSNVNVNPFWQRLLQTNQLSAPDMSFYLTRYRGQIGVQPESPGGLFTLGGTNPLYYQGDIEFLPYPIGITPRYWMLELANLTVGSTPIYIVSALVAFDTATTLIGGPTPDVANFWSVVPGSKALTGTNAGLYSFPCNTTIQASISFGGRVWPINPSDLNLGSLSGGNDCVGGVFDVTLGAAIPTGAPSWIIGEAFLKNVYTVFRASPLSVGFAQVAATPGQAPTPPATGTPSPVGSSPSGLGDNSPPVLSGASAIEPRYVLLIVLVASVLGLRFDF